mmetsp:Transcript_41905/g.64549  ORF Transcript_41905/g.64549 Transcript_41905/m.64549 type:complete len:88 (+) Transcript_41905:88-351(+)
MTFTEEMERAKQWAHQQCRREDIIRKICRHENPLQFLYKCKTQNEAYNDCQKENIDQIREKGKKWRQQQLAKSEMLQATKFDENNKE